METEMGGLFLEALDEVLAVALLVIISPSYSLPFVAAAPMLVAVAVGYERCDNTLGIEVARCAKVVLGVVLLILQVETNSRVAAALNVGVVVIGWAEDNESLALAGVQV